MGLFATLNTGYSGLNVNQSALAVTSNNISNASNPDYTRQRAQIVSASAIHTPYGDIGNGAKIETIVRIKNDYLFSRYESANRDLSYYMSLQQNIEEIANYFPDVKDVGLNKDIQEYYDAWSNFANNPNDNALKVDLASKTQILANTIKETRQKIDTLNNSVNSQIKIYADEVNDLVKEIASLNGEISKVEANNINHANQLRDKRDSLQKRLVELTGANVSKGGLESFGKIDSNIADYDENYVITLGGYPLVDNSTYHSLKVDTNETSTDAFYSIYFQKQDYSLEDITQNIPTHSIIGGLLEFRGTIYDENGKTTNGISNRFVDELDAFSRTLIQHTNSIYAYSAQEAPTGEQLYDPISLTSDQINKYILDSKQVKNSLKNPVRDGILTLSAYDNSGKFIKDIKIEIDINKTLQQNLDEINSKLKNENVDYKAVIQNGNITFVKEDTNNDNTLSNGALLVKDDGSLLFNALNEVNYKPISKANYDIPLPIRNGSFDIVVYDEDGEELSRRTITINTDSDDPLYSTMEGVLAQINMSNVDDNDNNSSNDDVDDLYTAHFTNGALSLYKNSDETTYIGFDNDSSNFSGAMKINQFFSGNDSKTIALDDRFVDNPSLINAYKAPSEGNNDVANEMVQMQYNKLEFTTKDSTTTNTISGYYRYIVSDIANETDRVGANVDNQKAIFNTVEQEYQSISGVNLDEEMTNLMKFQSGYQAAAKVITTISTMLDALMGIKS
jgi:flagellar hook-associated protein 1 FlgK